MLSLSPVSRRRSLKAATNSFRRTKSEPHGHGQQQFRPHTIAKSFFGRRGSVRNDFLAMAWTHVRKVGYET